MQILLAALLLQDTEAALRDRFTKAFKDKNPETRVDALRTLTGAKEAKSVALVIAALKEPSTKVRKAAAEVLGTAGDPAAAGIRPLCELLKSTKEDPEVRLASARSLMAAPYKAEAIDAMIVTISGIGEGEKALFNFGADVTKVLNSTAGQDFGAGKETPAKWKAWWGQNQTKITREDDARRAERKKSSS